jgi:phage-related minor tail protein
MEETADSAGESADELEGFSEQFSGAMGGAVAALAVGATGLLEQVPVLGELFGGLTAIVEALAFQMDGVLRPVLSPLTELFFKVSGAIFNADGVIGSLIGGVTSIVALLGVAIPAIAKVGALLGVWASTGAGVVSILGSIASVILGVAGTIISLPAILVAALVAIVAFAAAYLTNWRGTRDKTKQFVGEIFDFVVGGFTSFASDALEVVSDFAVDVRDWFLGLVSDIGDFARDLANRAQEWGANLILGFIKGIESFTQFVVDAIANVVNALVATVNQAIETLPEEVRTTLGLTTLSTVEAPDIDFVPNSGGETAGRPRPSSAVGGGLTVDGRQLAESTGRYRTDPARRRGV